jgi:hypothetical protein
MIPTPVQCSVALALIPIAHRPCRLFLKTLTPSKPPPILAHRPCRRRRPAASPARARPPSRHHRRRALPGRPPCLAAHQPLLSPSPSPPLAPHTPAPVPRHAAALTAPPPPRSNLSRAHVLPRCHPHPCSSRAHWAARGPLRATPRPQQAGWHLLQQHQKEEKAEEEAEQARPGRAGRRAASWCSRKVRRR